MVVEGLEAQQQHEQRCAVPPACHGTGFGVTGGVRLVF
jgi:hypothetical protein